MSITVQIYDPKKKIEKTPQPHCMCAFNAINLILIEFFDTFGRCSKLLFYDNNWNGQSIDSTIYTDDCDFICQNNYIVSILNNVSSEVISVKLIGYNEMSELFYSLNQI